MKPWEQDSQDGRVEAETLNNSNPFNCCLVGEDTLLISCSEVLLNKGHEITWIVSRSPAIQHWARDQGIPCFESITAAKQLPSKFDYLFSIANGQILKEEELQLPRKFAINYHYSLLPKYAGPYATSWAILNEEKTHGITWHLMTTEIDGGDILKQRQFPIDKNETALSLNLKCFEQAIQTFEELVVELETNSFVLRKQDLSIRSYFPLKKRPPRNGLIFWYQSAEDIYKLHRALIFGKYFNQLGVLKLMVGTDIFHVKSLGVSTIRSIAAPGTVIKVSEKELQIATTTFDVLILELFTLEGVLIPLSDFVKEFTIKVGWQLPIPEQEYFDQLEQTASQYVRFEEYWVEAFSNLIPGKEAFFVNTKNNHYHLKRVSVTSVPDSIYHSVLTSLGEASQARELLLTGILVYFYRLNGFDNFSAMFSYPDLAEATPFPQYYADQLPLTSTFSPTMNFREALAVVISKLHSLKEHQTYGRDINQRYPQLAGCLDIDLMHIEMVLDLESYTPKQAPLSIVMTQDGSELAIFADENMLALTSLSHLMHYFSAHILELLTGALMNPNQTLFQVPLLTPFEKQQILIDWNNTTVLEPENKTVIELFEAQCLKTPQHTAVVFNDLSLSFEALNEKANQLAHFLDQPEVSSKLVGLCMERSLEMVIAILAVLKAGGAYIPLDPHHPIPRLSYMLEDSQATLLLLNNSTLTKSFPSFKGSIIDLVEQQPKIKKQSKMNLQKTIYPEQLAYVIYTSGTTGKPKGVAIPQAALSNHMLWMIPKFNFTENDIFLQKTAFSFDASIWEFFAPLLCGGKLIMAINGEPNEIVAFVKKYQVTVLQLVPSLLRQLLEDTEFQACDSLQQVFVGGEALLPDTVKLFFKCMPEVQLHNLYGPTEATIQVITHSYQKQDLDALSATYIGKPINNVQAYVLDEYLNPVPVGLTGELYLGGRCLANGYLNQAELTKERFIKNPFDQKESRLYKTGDRVRWLPEGKLEYRDRLDDQCKFNGFRIELSEIEAALLQHERIQDCAVLVQEHSCNDEMAANQSLVAFYVKKQNLTPFDVQDFLRNWTSLHNAQYALLEDKNYKANIQGWKSSYTGQTIELESMLEWINNTVDSIKLLNPYTVLEIGSGTGLILFNILDSCQNYYATDFSTPAICYTQEVVEKLGLQAKVNTLICSAHQLPYKTLEKPYDTVVMNSVIQYFPSLQYLENVILEAIYNMTNSGKVFIGDIRDFRLLECFHYSVLTYKQKKTTKAEVAYFALRDKELLVAPVYFTYLQAKIKHIASIEILPKRGDANHEMNNYRYDVILHIRKSTEKTNDNNIPESEFREIINFKEYIEANPTSERLCIKYPNKRIAKDYLNYQILSNTVFKQDPEDYQKILSIREMINFAQLKGFLAKCFIDISDPLYLYVVLFSEKSSLACQNISIKYSSARSISPDDLSNHPLAIQKMLEDELPKELKAFMSQKLPSYMLPSRYIPLEKMPLNLHGKIDKAALFKPELIRTEEYRSPRNDIEIKMCKLWAKVLGLSEDNISISDDFFSLGGHSLAALRVLCLTKKVFGLQLPTRVLFEYPTIEKLALFLENTIENPALISQQNLMASPLIALQKNGFKAPLFMIHPLGGTIFWYKTLSRYLGKARPIYAIQDPAIQAQKFIFNHLEEMASFYLNTIKEVQQKGPYLLAGASFGGTVAIEIASQLLKNKEKVNFIGLLDAWPVYSEKFWQKGFLEKLMLPQLQREMPTQGVDDLDFLIKLYQHRASMLKHYEIPLVEAKLTFFKAMEVWPAFKDMTLPKNCWQPYSSQEIDIQLVPGNHETMFWEPQVQLLAKKINMSLEEIDRTSHSISYKNVNSF